MLRSRDPQMLVILRLSEAKPKDLVETANSLSVATRSFTALRMTVG
jgi:hypothetical protein